MKAKDKKQEVIYLRIPLALKTALEELAAKEKRSLNNYLEIKLTELIKKSK